MTDVPFITIAIASYNYAKYLSRMFEAIKKQKFSDYEVLYVDDCSSDNSVEIIQKFIVDNPDMKIRLLQNEKNKGLIFSKNRLIEEAKGLYLMLCDADDFMDDNCLEKLADIAKNTEADRIISQVKDTDENGKLIQIQNFNNNQSKWLWNIHHGVLYRLDVIRKNNIKILAYPDDIYFTTDFNMFSKKTVFCFEPLYTWFVHNDSAGRKQIFDNKFNEIIETYTQLFYFIDNRIKLLMDLDAKSPIFEGKSKNENISALQLLMLKSSWLAILGELRRFPYVKMLIGYFQLRKNLKSVYRNSLNNEYLSFSKESPMRPYATKIVRWCMFFEKLHIMPVVLFFYSIITKFIIFDQ